ncbi:MAG TPA: 3-oxoacyl-ACP reductase FabG [Steroidobacteraceae bacterium]|nr:3-oxoacyl-ACP reductase FabG [Steroidobacteraceae bacterium]
MTSNLQGQTALVTGASRGIGRAIALRLAAAGAKVIGTATTEEGAAKITAELSASGGRGEALNVSTDGSIEALVARLDAAGDMPTILVNNAAITRDTLLLRMKNDDWDQVIDTNLSANFRLTKLCVKRMMKERNGRIISITSVVGLMGNAGQVNYAAAKAGVIGLTKSIARELASRNITANAVAPGFIDTDMTKGLPEEQKQALLKQIPAGRLGSPEDIAEAVAFLASPAAAYITGQTLSVNGGMLMP